MHLYVGGIKHCGKFEHRHTLNSFGKRLKKSKIFKVILKGTQVKSDICFLSIYVLLYILD